MNARAIALAVATVQIGACAGLGGPDPRIAACGGSGGGKVLTAFEMPRARDFWSHFPAAPREAPELEVDTPVFVVVFDGPTMVRGAVLDDVVCVLMPPSDLHPQGEPLVYHDVPRDGFRP
jgi:hypothetical protein